MEDEKFHCQSMLCSFSEAKVRRSRLTGKDDQVHLVPLRPNDLALVHLPKYALVITRVLQRLAGPGRAVPVGVRSILGSLVDGDACDVDPLTKVAEAVYVPVVVAFDCSKVTVAGVDTRVPCM